MSALDPGELAGALAELVVEIETVEVETGPVEVDGYYAGEPRPRAVVRLEGGGAAGRGECVAWTRAAQAEFAALARALAPPGRTTVGGLEARLRRAADDPYHRAAVEAAAIDLALAQASTNPFERAGRAPRPVAFCRSINETDDPVVAVEAVLARDPGARIKIDCPEDGWEPTTWEALAETGRIVVVDLKGRGPAQRPARVHAAIPTAWIEDPPAAVLDAAGASGWGTRVALDRPIARAADLDRPPIEPAAINVKAPRMGGWLEALRALEACRLRGWHAYVGGMFEVDVGRPQARVLASLFTAEAWNDLAPLDAPTSTSPLSLEAGYAGFAPR